MSTARYGWANARRLLCRATTAVLLFCCVGCTTASKAPSKLPNPFDWGSKDQSLRKQVDADPFPPAKQAGL